MASGKKNYFRHSFFARNDIKLLELREQIGVGYYFYYFSLLELCGESSSDDFKEKYIFHDSTIRNLWRVNLKKSEHVASVMNAVGLLEFKKLENSFQFTIPNFSKYMGRYETKFPSNSPNKRKEKEIKIKESKSPIVPTSNLEMKPIRGIVRPEKIGVHELVELWDQNFHDTLGCARGFGGGIHMEKFVTALGFLPEKKSWQELFDQIKNSPYLMGKNDRGWKVDLTWIVDYDNAVKVLNGRYAGVSSSTWLESIKLE